MVHTTPPPPLDVTAVFPELGPLARPAIRLHPRAGAPGPDDSSLGGPLLWPADEPWPACHGQLLGERRESIAPADLQRFRAILDAAHRRWRPAQGQAATVTTKEAAEIERIQADAGSLDLTAGERVWLVPRPHQHPPPLVAVLQLYARDVPDLPFPDHTDLFQLLWCPNWHAAPWCGPHPVTVWRTAAQVGQRLAAPPAPRFDGLDRDLAPDDYVPRPCVVHPEPVIECPHPDDLPDQLAERVKRWDEGGGGRYWAELSTTPGTKVGGHPGWIQDPQWPVCGCGRRMDHLLTIASGEFGSLGRWTRLMDRGAWAPHGIKLGGGGGSLYLFACTVCAERPLAGVLQR
jgi:hypothetical protein